jgi:hypothetical protein
MVEKPSCDRDEASAVKPTATHEVSAWRYIDRNGRRQEWHWACVLFGVRVTPWSKCCNGMRISSLSTTLMRLAEQGFYCEREKTYNLQFPHSLTPYFKSSLFIFENPNQVFFSTRIQIKSLYLQESRTSSHCLRESKPGLFTYENPNQVSLSSRIQTRALYLRDQILSKWNSLRLLSFWRAFTPRYRFTLFPSSAILMI